MWCFFCVCVCVHGTKWFTLYLHPQKWSEKIGHFLSQICDMIPAPPGQPWMQPVCDLRNSFQLSNNSKSDAERVSRFLSLFNLSNKKNANRSTEFSASPWHHLTWSVQGSGSGLLHAMNSGTLQREPIALETPESDHRDHRSWVYQPKDGNEQWKLMPRVW